jgi:hypothetical protein
LCITIGHSHATVLQLGSSAAVDILDRGRYCSLWQWLVLGLYGCSTHLLNSWWTTFRLEQDDREKRASLEDGPVSAGRYLIYSMLQHKTT